MPKVRGNFTFETEPGTEFDVKESDNEEYIDVIEDNGDENESDIEDGELEDEPSVSDGDNDVDQGVDTEQEVQSNTEAVNGKEQGVRNKENNELLNDDDNEMGPPIEDNTNDLKENNDAFRSDEANELSQPADKRYSTDMDEQ